MSTEREPSQIHEIPEYQELASMLAREASMRQALDDNQFASEVIKGAYENGLNLLQENAQKLATSPELQDSVALVGAKCLATLCQLKIDQPADPNEQLDLKTVSLEQTLQDVKHYFETYGALTKEAAVAVLAIARLGSFTLDSTILAQAEETVIAQEKSKPKTVKPEAGDNKSEVVLRFGKKGLLIGRSGTINKYPSYESISNACQQILGLMIDSPADSWSISGALDELGIEYEDLGKDRKQATAEIREWLLASVYMGQQLVVRHGQSTNTAYGWSPDFTPTLVQVEDNSGVLEIKGAEALDEQTATAVLERARNERVEASQKLEELKDEVWLIDGLRASSLYFTARKLQGLSHVLDGYGLPTINDEIATTLKAYLPGDIRELHNIASYKQQAYEEVIEIFDNDTLVNALISHFTEDFDETATKFIEFLTDLLHNTAKKALVRRILNSNPATKSVSVGKSSILDVKNIVVDENGAQLWPIPSKQQTQAAPAVQTKLVDSASTERVSGSDQEQALLESLNRPVVEQPIAEPVQLTPEQKELAEEYQKYGRNRHDERRRSKLDEVEAKARLLAASFVSSFGVNTRPKITAINSAFRGFERTAMSRHNRSHIKSHHRKNKGERPVFSLREFLQISLEQDSGLRNTVVSHSNIKLVSNIIDRIASELEAQEKPKY